jgi:hypothetical protein
MKNERHRSATVPATPASHPGADHPDEIGTGIISGSFFIGDDRVRGKSGSLLGAHRPPQRFVFMKTFTSNEMRGRGKPKGVFERKCITYTLAMEIPGKLTGMNETEFAPAGNQGDSSVPRTPPAQRLQAEWGLVDALCAQ